MDAQEFIQLHADNVVAQNMGEVMKDLTPEALQQVMALMATMPNPVTGSSIVARGQQGEDQVFDVTYSGDSGSVALRDSVRQIDGNWKIVNIAKPE
jgi:hypothetical protein